MSVVTLTAQHYDTLLPDGSQYSTTTDPALSVNRIGEYKRIRLEFYIPGSNLIRSGSDGQLNIFIIPALYLDKSIIKTFVRGGSYYYGYTLPYTAAPGDEFKCILQRNDQTFVPQFKNWEVIFKLVDNEHFEVHLYYYQIYDTDNYLNPALEDNHSKLLKDRKSNPLELIVNGNSIYTYDLQAPRIYFYLENRDVPSSNLYAEVVCSGYKAGFYAKNEHQTAPYFTSPQFILKNTAGSNVNTLSLTETMTMYFRVNSATPVTKVLMWLIRTDTNDNTVDFIENYEASFADVGITGDNKLISPMVSPYNNISGQYECSITIDKNKLTQDASYRFIAVVYGGTNTNSFISGEVSASGLPCYGGLGLDIYGRVSDYDHEYSMLGLLDTLEASIEERLRSKIKFEYSGNKWKNDILSRLGIVTVNDVRRYLTSINFKIYEEYSDSYLGNVVNIFEEGTATKLNPFTYNTPQGMTLSFGNGFAEFWYDFRNRYENTIDCIKTLINGVNTTPVLSSQYWGGKSLKIEWTFNFNYDDYSGGTFEDKIICNQKLKIYDYEINQAAILGANINDVSGWSVVGAGCSIAVGVATFVNTSGYRWVKFQRPAEWNGYDFEFTFEVENYVSGTLSLYGITPFTFNANGVYTQIIKAYPDGKFYLEDDNTVLQCTIDLSKITIKPVLQAERVAQLELNDKETGVEIESYCKEGIVCLEVEYTGVDVSTFHLITAIEKAPGTIDTIEENETWEGSELEQLTTGKIINQEETFGQTDLKLAYFCIDTDKLSYATYKVTAMAKKLQLRYRRITEESNVRITEGGSTRVPNNN